MRKIIFTALSILLPLVLGAQTINVEAPNLVAVDEQFNVSFTIDGESAPGSIDWAPGPDFKLVWGPQKGTSTSVSIVNGKRSKSSRTTFTYVLMPLREGTFTLPSASASIKGKTVSSGARSIQVVGSSARGSAASSVGQSAQSEKQTGVVGSDEIFMRLTLSKGSAVMGETIRATLKLYTRAQIAGFEDARFPTFDGFWSQEVQAPSNIEFERENVNGQIYSSAVLRSWTLIPQKTGALQIDPAELVCLVNVRQPSSGSGSIFDSFFQDDYRTIRKRVSTKAVSVRVNPLPAGAPASFGGGVGEFSIKGSLTKDSLRAHDAASLILTVTGKGNIALLEAPKVDFPPDFEVYDTKTSDSKGGKTFEYPFIPRSHGQFSIGPVQYSYYDVSAGRYVTLTVPEMPISVTRAPGSAQGGAPSGAGQVVSGAERKDVKDLGNDIRFISTRTPNLSVAGSFFVGSAAFWAVVAALLLIAAGIWAGMRKIAAQRADVAGTRTRGAVKAARKRLSQAGEFLSKNLYTAFYEELHRALLGFVADRLNMDIAELSHENISSRVQEAGVSESLAAEFTALLEACEYARYSPDSGHEAMSAHYERAVNTISSMDECMKKNKGGKKSAAGAAVALLLMLLPGVSRADSYTDSLWVRGVDAYTQGQYDEALGAWESLAGTSLCSPELYTNIADACYKSGDFARAILWYERALKLDPSFADARFNLQIAQAQTTDRIDAVPEFFLTTWVRALGYKLPSDTWAVLFLVLLAGAIACVLLFLLGASSRSRRAGFYSGIALLLLSLACLLFAQRQKREFLRSDTAVVLSGVAPVKSAPGAQQSKDLFVLHEGTKVKILDNVGSWSKVELSDGRQGWSESDNFEKI